MPENNTENTVEKAPSKLAVMLKGHKRGSDKDIAFAKEKLEEARAKTEKARRALEAAETAEEVATEKMIRCAGRARVRLSTGEVVYPSCRGDRVFYRSDGGADIV